MSKTGSAGARPGYSIIIPEDTEARAAGYLRELRLGRAEPGILLRDRLQGDVSVAVPVTVFDDGKHGSPTPHTTPFPGVLIFTAGSRATDDGVKAAATSSMSVLSGVEGRYDPACGRYQPPQPCRSWGEVVAARVNEGSLRLWDPLAVWRPAGAQRNPQ